VHPQLFKMHIASSEVILRVHAKTVFGFPNHYRKRPMQRRIPRKAALHLLQQWHWTIGMWLDGRTYHHLQASKQQVIVPTGSPLAEKGEIHVNLGWQSSSPEDVITLASTL
jgi:hypothetical protein